MAHLSALQIFGILLAGIVPPLFWLWFWLKEDRRRPEPRGLLVLSFFGGALVILFVLPLQKLSNDLLVQGVLLLLVWAFIEELAKYLVALFVDFRKRSYDEPIDSMIYMVTVALGFAAFENVLFLIKSMSTSGLTVSIVTACMRFVGATLLHVFASAVLGGIIALSFCETRTKKRLYTVVGIVTATLLHTMFNYFIMNVGVYNPNIVSVFVILWIGIIFLLLFFEKVKTIVCKINFNK